MNKLTRPSLLSALAGVVLASMALASPFEARAAPPGVRRAPHRTPAAASPSGRLGVLANMGIGADLGLDAPTAFRGTAFIIEAQLLQGRITRGAWLLAPGVRLGFGRTALHFEPLVDLHYRFALPGLPRSLPLYPYVGGGALLKTAFGRYTRFHLGFAVRAFAGLEYFLSREMAVGLRLSLPEVGPLFAPFVVATGATAITLTFQHRFSG